MNHTWYRLVRGLVGALLVTMGSVAHAQAVVTGRVTAARGEALGGAIVRIDELNLGIATTVHGTYSLTVPAERARGQLMTLGVRHIGYSPATRQIALEPGSQEQNFELAADPLRLAEIVVTGTASATDTRKLPFSVGHVSEAELQATPGVNALDALAGKVAGARVLSRVGDPGYGTSIRLRSSTTFTRCLDEYFVFPYPNASSCGQQSPLTIVDGTITRLTLADLNGEDIERIEIVKGAAASSLYGSDAANGVVQIFTKRGDKLADGSVTVTARQEYGLSYLPTRIPQSQAHVYQIDANGDYVLTASGARIVEPDHIADNPYKVSYDHQNLFLTNGAFRTSYLAIGQRKGNTNFNASFQHTTQQGIVVELNGYSRQNLRLNVDQALGPRLDLSLGAFYARSDNDQQTGEPFFGLMFLEPDVDLTAPNPDGSPYRAGIPDAINASNPLYQLANDRYETARARFTGSARVTWRARDWLSAEAHFNYDQAGQATTWEVPFGFLNPSGQPTDGSLFKEDVNGQSYNGGLTLTSIQSFGAVRNTTKAAFVFEDQRESRFTLSAGAFTVKRVPQLTAVDPLQLAPSSADEVIRNRNYYLVTTFDIKDRYILDGLVRRDRSSLFGRDQRSQTYYRVSGAWRVTQDVRLGGLDELRLRASFGTAGLRPPFEAQYESFDIGGGLPVKQRLGNTALKPARSSELEVGLNLEFLRRFTAEYSYSRKVTRDQFLLVPVSAGTGYQSQWQNAGTLEGQSHEFALGMLLADSRELFWRLNITADRTRQKVTALATPPFFYGGGIRIQVGEPFGVIYGRRVVRRIEDLYDDPAKAALSGPGQTWSRDSVLVNEEGYVVRRATWRTLAERPILYVAPNGERIVSIGDVNPDFNASFATDLRYKDVSLHALVDWVQGGAIYNQTRQLPFFERRDRVFDQRSKPAAERKPIDYYNVFFNNAARIDYFLESGTYVKLKELAVHYTVPQRAVGRLGLGLRGIRVGMIGRNLFTVTGYSGFDPEVASYISDPFMLRVDNFAYPNFRTLTGVVELTF